MNSQRSHWSLTSKIFCTQLLLVSLTGDRFS